jgi:hypothetical protein
LTVLWLSYNEIQRLRDRLGTLIPDVVVAEEQGGHDPIENAF